MSEAKGPYFEKEDYSVHSMNAAYAEGFKAGRASRDGLRKALADLFAVVNGECPSLLHEDSGGASYLYLQIKEALEADGECVK